MPHCYIAEKSLVYHFGKELKKKMETVYPAIESRNYRARQDVKTVKILFIANKFFEKGGLEVLQACKALEKKYDFQLIFKCKVPEQYKRKFFSNNIIFLERNFSYNELFSKIYAKSNIFIFPSFIDTFGFALLEAMSVGLPVVTINIFAFPEIVENGKNGFLVNAKEYDWADENGVMKIKWLLNPENRMKLYLEDKPEIVRQITEKISLLIENTSLRKKMGGYGRKLIEKGKFSVKERNKKLETIYDEALKSQ